jgi:hypothetical protein
VAASAFHDGDRLKQIAINLFYGWGYNFYRLENQLRADDLMVRGKLCELLATARASVESAETAYRREFLPPPTRERPRPDAQAIQNAQALEALARELGALEGHVRALPAPENDRMTERLRREADTLSRLVEADQAMVGHGEFLRSLLTGASAGWILEHASDLRAQIAALEAALQTRRDLLAF